MEFEYYFDFSCPYAYLGLAEARKVAATTGAAMVMKPMLLGGIFRSLYGNDGPMTAYSPAKAAHNESDMTRFALTSNTSLQMPSAHPMRTVLALRVLLALPNDHWSSYIDSVYRAYWVDGKNIADQDVLVTTMELAGISEKEIQEAVLAASSEKIKKELRTRTDEALAVGVFGAPTFAVFPDEADKTKRSLYWGQDKGEMVAAALGGWNPPLPPQEVRTWIGSKQTDISMDFWFDFASPFAYLGATQVESFCRAHSITLRYRPMLLGALFRNIGTEIVPLFAFPEAKKRYAEQEVARWASFWDVPFEFSKHFPANTVTALRAILATPDEKRPEITNAIFRAFWVENKNIVDKSVLQKVIDSAGLKGEFILEQTGEQRIKEVLFANTKEAQTIGVFGAPTFVLQNSGRDQQWLFWGQDRLDLVDKILSEGILEKAP